MRPAVAPSATCDVTAVILAAASALVWGTADYSGGRATQRASALGITVASQILGLPVLAFAVVVLGGHLYTVDVAWGAAAGVAGFLGIVLLYQGLSTGSMAVVAPITAVTGALIPMGVGLVTQQMPSVLALAGAMCAVVAIGLVSLDPASAAGGRALAGAGARVVGLALASGAMFGVFFSLVAQTRDDSGMWPLVAARFSSVLLGLVVGWRRGVSPRLPRPIIVWVLVAGVGDIAANVLFLLAVREGLLTVVAPIAALYPVSTVLLALTLDRERMRPIQIAGLGLAATALVLTAV